MGKFKYVALAIVGLYVLFQIIAPLVILIWASLLNRFEVPSLAALDRISLANYARIGANSSFWLAVRNTLVVALGSATLVTLVSTTIAWLIIRKEFLGKRGLDFLASSSMAIPGVVAGFAFLLFYVYIGRWVPIFGTVWVLVLAYSYRLSWGYRLQSAAILQIGPELVEAAQVGGATWLRTFRLIALPLLMPSLVVVFATTFFLGFRDFTLALMLSSGQNVVISVLIWSRFIENFTGEAAAMSLIAFVMMFFVAIMLRLIATKSQKAAR